MALNSELLTFPTNSPGYLRSLENVSDLKNRLGKQAVRSAKPWELLMFQLAEASTCCITNPTAEGLVFTVSIRGDEKRIGTRMASVGHRVFLPPGCALIVSNLYWTTPSIKQEPD